MSNIVNASIQRMESRLVHQLNASCDNIIKMINTRLTIMEERLNAVEDVVELTINQLQGDTEDNPQEEVNDLSPDVVENNENISDNCEKDLIDCRDSEEVIVENNEINNEIKVDEDTHFVDRENNEIIVDEDCHFVDRENNEIIKSQEVIENNEVNLQTINESGEAIEHQEEDIEIKENCENNRDEELV